MHQVTVACARVVAVSLWSFMMPAASLVVGALHKQEAGLGVNSSSSIEDMLACMRSTRMLFLQVRGYEAEVRQLEARVRSGAPAGDRAELLGQRADAGLPGSASQRDRLLQSNQKLDKSGERIQQSRQMVADMEVQASLKHPKLCLQLSTHQDSMPSHAAAASRVYALVLEA